MCYAILIEVTCTCIMLTSLLTDFRKGNLTYREWSPYNYTSKTVYRVIYARQLMGATLGATANIACDSLICGLLVHICCQIEILECRLRKISLGRAKLSECVRQHDLIFELVSFFSFCRIVKEKEIYNIYNRVCSLFKSLNKFRANATELKIIIPYTQNRHMRTHF